MLFKLPSLMETTITKGLDGGCKHLLILPRSSRQCLLCEMNLLLNVLASRPT